MTGSGLPLDAIHWSLAIIPLVLLLVVLVGLRWKAHEAASVGMFAALLIGVFVFRSPMETISVASAKGIWDAVFVLYVVWPALLFYHVIDRADGFTVLREGIQRFTDNELFLVLGFGWVFVSFMQSISGFGAPIVVAAPLLLALGVKPVYAVAIPLIGHAWANTFGTLGVAWLALEQVVEMQNVAMTAFSLGILLWIPNLLAGLTIAWIYGRWAAVKYALPLIAIVSLIQGGGQLTFTLWDPTMANFLAASLGLAALYPLSQWGRYASETGSITSRPAMSEGITKPDTAAADGGTTRNRMTLGLAIMPFVVLAAIAFLTSILTPIGTALESLETGLAFPAVETDYGVTTESAAPYDPFAPLTHPGTFLLGSTIVAYVVYRYKGYYESDSKTSEPGMVTALSVSAIPASVAIIAFLVMAKLMDHTGQTLVLAMGTAEVASPTSYGFLSPLIGVLGSFMTSSNTASNILFGGLQQETALGLGGLSEPLVLAGQSTGGAIGNAISPANVILGTSAIGIVGKEGDVLRAVIPWVSAVAATVGIAILALNGIMLAGGV